MEDLSHLRQWMLAQRADHIGVMVKSYDVHDPTSPGTKVDSKPINPSNPYGQPDAVIDGLKYDSKWFQNQYGDAGICADSLIWQINVIHQQAGLDSPIPLTTGLGYGTAQLQERAEELGMTVDTIPENFKPGNIITFKINEDEESIKADKYHGHTNMVWDFKPLDGEPNKFLITTTDAGFSGPVINMNYFVYDESSNTISVYDIETGTFAQEGNNITSLIDIDRLPHADQLNQHISNHGIHTLTPHGDYTNGLLHASLNFDSALDILTTQGIDAKSFIAKNDLRIFNEMLDSATQAYINNPSEVAKANIAIAKSAEFANDNDLQLTTEKVKELLLIHGTNNEALNALILSSDNFSKHTNIAIETFANNDIPDFYDNRIFAALQLTKSSQDPETLVKNALNDAANNNIEIGPITALQLMGSEYWNNNTTKILFEKSSENTKQQLTQYYPEKAKELGLIEEESQVKKESEPSMLQSINVDFNLSESGISVGADDPYPLGANHFPKQPSSNIREV